MKNKPLTAEEKKLLNSIAKELAYRWITKQEIMGQFNLSERRTRDCVSLIAKRVPIISKSNGKGYKRAIGDADFDDAIQARNELNSRIRELTARRDVLNKFLNKFAYKEMKEM